MVPPSGRWQRMGGLCRAAIGLMVLVTLGTSLGWAGVVKASVDVPGSTSPVVPPVGMVTDLTWGISRADMDRTVELLVKSGVRWVRLNTNWSAVERDGKGVINEGWLAENDAAVRKALDAGLQVLMPIADGVPHWASADPKKRSGSWNTMWRPERMSDYADFVEFVVRRYGPLGVAHFEIWNEPNLAHFWPSGVDAASYTEMLRAGSAAVRRADPKAKVVLGGLSKSDSTYMSALYAAGAGTLFDVGAIHPYTGSTAPGACWNDGTGRKAKDAFCGIEAVRDVMVANGDSAKSLWLTEFGWSTTSSAYGVSEAQQASYLSDAYDWLATRRYVTNTFWYGFRNTFWMKDDPIEYEANAGLIRTDFSAKPSLANLRAVTAKRTYVPLDPARVLDTRLGGTTVDGLAAGSGAIAPGATRTLQVAGRGGVPAVGAGAVAVNVTAVSPTSAGFMTVFPTGEDRPLASNLNFSAGQTIPNMVITKVGSDGRVSIYNSSGSVHLLADLAGWFPNGPNYIPLTPARLVDTRTGDGTTLAAGSTRMIQVNGRGGVPTSGAGAVVLNITATAPTKSGFLTVFPSGEERPLASNLNFAAGQTIPNLVIARIGTGGRVSVYNDVGSTHVIADVVGWFPTGSGYSSLSPSRLMDTRTGAKTVDGLSLAGGAIGPGATRTLQVTGRGGVPAGGVGSVVLNITGTGPTTGGFLTVFPANHTRPVASNLNFVIGDTVPNLVMTKVSIEGEVSIYNGSGSTHVIVDVAGWLPTS